MELLLAHNADPLTGSPRLYCPELDRWVRNVEIEGQQQVRLGSDDTRIVAIVRSRDIGENLDLRRAYLHDLVRELHQALAIYSLNYVSVRRMFDSIDNLIDLPITPTEIARHRQRLMEQDMMMTLPNQNVSVQMTINRDGVAAVNVSPVPQPSDVLFTYPAGSGGVNRNGDSFASGLLTRAGVDEARDRYDGSAMTTFHREMLGAPTPPEDPSPTEVPVQVFNDRFLATLNDPANVSAAASATSDFIRARLRRDDRFPRPQPAGDSVGQSIGNVAALANVNFFGPSVAQTAPLELPPPMISGIPQDGPTRHSLGEVRDDNVELSPAELERILNARVVRSAIYTTRTGPAVDPTFYSGTSALGTQELAEQFCASFMAQEAGTRRTMLRELQDMNASLHAAVVSHLRGMRLLTGSVGEGTAENPASAPLPAAWRPQSPAAAVAAHRNTHNWVQFNEIQQSLMASFARLWPENPISTAQEILSLIDQNTKAELVQLVEGPITTPMAMAIAVANCIVVKVSMLDLQRAFLAVCIRPVVSPIESRKVIFESLLALFVGTTNYRFVQSPDEQAGNHSNRIIDDARQLPTPGEIVANEISVDFDTIHR